MSKKVAIITVVHENYIVLEDFFKSLISQSDKDFHLFISDLSSVKKPIKKNGIDFTVLEGNNRGYAHGVNLGLKEAVNKGYELFCVVNNDVIFKENFVASVRNSLDKNPGSIIGGKIYYAPGYEYHQKKYNKEDLGNVLWYAGGKIDWDHMMPTHRGVDEVDDNRYGKLEQTEFVTGCLTLFDKKVFDKLGFWDESYFLYYEDADFSIKALKKGVDLIYDPSIVIWHKVSQSTDGSGSLIHQKYQNRNRVKLGLKYAPLRTKLHLIKNFLFDSLRKK
jgi:GT2 family glycosyltransferase